MSIRDFFLGQSGKPEATVLSVRVFRLTSLVCAILCTFVFWPTNLFEPDIPRSVNFVLVGLGLLSLIIFWESTKGRHHIALFLVAMLLVLDFVWFKSGGFGSGMPLFFPSVLTLAVVFYPDWRGWVALALMVLDFIVIWILSCRYPLWTIALQHPGEAMLDTAVCVLFNTLTLVTIFQIVIYNYYRERRGIERSERKYRDLFENMTVGFALHEIICDAAGKPVDYRYLEANPAFEQLTGIPVKNLVGKTIRELKPATEDYWIEVFGAVALTGKPRKYVNFSKELGRYYETWTFQPAPGRFAVMFSDVTDKKLAELKVEQQAHWLDEAEDAIAVVGLDGKFNYVNEAWARIHGYEKNEFIGRPLSFVHTAEQWKECAKLNDEVARTGRVQTEIGHLRKDGSTFPMWLSVSEVRNADGQLTGFLGIGNDVTERKLAEMALRRESQKNLALLRNASDGIHILDLEGNLLEASAAFYRMLGHDPMQPPSKLHVSDWDAKWSESELRGRMVQHFNEPRRVFETVHRRKNGEIFPVEISIYGLEIDGKRMLFAASRDITERKVAEEKIREQAQLIDEAREAIVVRDLQGNIRLWNHGAEQIFGWTASEAIGQTPLKLGQYESVKFANAMLRVMD
jgi:PAS domain S-box-containing protein